MHRVILIDDEDEVREGIKCRTPWAAYGFELVGDFDNGRDALEAMERLKPDAVITDINMPYMDGLALSRSIRESYRDVKIAIVTGFENFDYAQQAIRLQVTDYLLKPLNLEDFTQFLGKMGGELAEERRRREDLSELRSRLHQSLPLLKERFLEKLATASTPPSDTERQLGSFDITLTGPLFVAMIADIDGTLALGGSSPSETADMELLQFGLYNVMQEIIEQESGGVVFRTRVGKVAAVLAGEGQRLGLLSQKLAEQVRQSAEKYMKLTISVGIGRPSGSWRELAVSYQEALSALDYRFLLGTGRTLSIQDMEFSRSNAGPDASGEWEKQLISAMRSGSRSRVSETVREGFGKLKETRVTAEDGYQAVRRMLAALRNWISGTGLEEPAAISEEAAAIHKIRTLGELEAWFETACCRILDDLSSQRSGVARSQMRLAEQYIQDHYANENLSLSDCCHHLFMSISYFSTLFKQHTGQTFVEYLTRTRIGKAKDILTLTAHKTYEIAQKVGYSDPHYFSVIFKRHTGMTPKEYRASGKE